MSHRMGWVRAMVCVFLLSSSAAFASQEGVLELSELTIKSKGIGSSGPISIAATKGKRCTFMSFTIKAFGRSYSLSKSELGKLSACYNGVMLTYERGYKSLGGKTLYIKLIFGFTSGVRKATLVTFQANGKLNITAVKKK